jgi:hypothetical protein
MNGTVIVDDGNVAKNNNLSESVADDCSRDVEAFGRSAAIALRSDEFAACFPDS